MTPRALPSRSKGTASSVRAPSRRASDPAAGLVGRREIVDMTTGARSATARPIAEPSRPIGIAAESIESSACRDAAATLSKSPSPQPNDARSYGLAEPAAVSAIVSSTG